MIKNVTVFCASSPSGEHAEKYLQIARDFGVLLAKEGFTCVNGGNLGMMTEICKSMHAAGGTVHCITLNKKDSPLEHDAYTHIEDFSPLSPRQQRLIGLGDAYVALPGGIGTHYEILEVLCRKALGEIDKQKLLLCVGDGYEPLRRVLESIVENGLSYSSPLDLIEFIPDIQTAIARLKEVNK